MSAQEKSSATRQMSLGVFVMTAGHHVAAWRMPEAYSGTKFSELVELAQIAEAAKFDMFFIADSPSVRLGNRDAASKGPHNFGAVLFEPLTLISALSSVTKNLGFVATASTQYMEPYNLARMFASLDIISGGRVAWNVVTTADPESARNYGLTNVVDHDQRYVLAEEYVDCVTALWDSWCDDAIVADRQSGKFLDLDKQRFNGFQSEHIKVGGPLNIPRGPQGHPVLVQAGASGPGRNLAARIADIVFTVGSSYDAATDFYQDLKKRAEDFGRQRENVLIMPGITPVVGSTEDEAKEKLERMNQAIDIDVALNGLQNFMPDIEFREFDLDKPLPDTLPMTQAQQSRQQLVLDMAKRENLTLRQLALRFAGTRGHNTVIGTPEKIADVMEEFFVGGACDGFNIMPHLFPDSFSDFTEHVVPVLQKRGLFRKEYNGPMLRDQLGLRRPELA